MGLKLQLSVKNRKKVMMTQRMVLKMKKVTSVEVALQEVVVEVEEEDVVGDGVADRPMNPKDPKNLMMTMMMKKKNLCQDRVKGTLFSLVYTQYEL